VRLLLFCFLFCIACGQEDTPTGLDESGSLKATISGSERIAPVVFVTMKKSSAQVANELSFIADFSSTTTGLSFSVSTNNIYGALQKGEFVAKGNNPAVSPVYFYYFLSDGLGAFTSTSVAEEVAGTVTITELDIVNKTVSGTFDANVKRGTETIRLTKGSFTRLKYTE